MAHAAIPSYNAAQGRRPDETDRPIEGKERGRTDEAHPNADENLGDDASEDFSQPGDLPDPAEDRPT